MVGRLKERIKKWILGFFQLMYAFMWAGFAVLALGLLAAFVLAPIGVFIIGLITICRYLFGG